MQTSAVVTEGDAREVSRIRCPRTMNPPLVEHCDAIIEKLRELAPKAFGDGEEEVIHQARVATRRMRAVLRLVGPVISDEQRKPLNRALRKLRRRLGGARDLDVMLGHLESLGRTHSYADAVDWLASRLREQRDEARRETKDDSASKTLARLGAWWGIHEEMSLNADRLDELLGESLHQQLDDFAAKADRLSNASDQADDPHELRIAGKSLRYTLEMAQAAGHAIGKPTLKTFKKLQDALGLWHDYVVLAERAMCESAEGMLAHHSSALQKELLRLVQRILKRADAQLRKFDQMWKTHGPEVTREIHAAFPREAETTTTTTTPTPATITSDEAAITARQTDRDLSGSDESAAQEVSRRDDPAAA